MNKLLRFLTTPHQLIGVRVPFVQHCYLHVALECRDLWRGAYWNTPKHAGITWELYVCIVPCLPIIIRKFK